MIQVEILLSKIAERTTGVVEWKGRLHDISRHWEHFYHLFWMHYRYNIMTTLQWKESLCVTWLVFDFQDVGLNICTLDHFHPLLCLTGLDSRDREVWLSWLASGLHCHLSKQNRQFCWYNIPVRLQTVADLNHAHKAQHKIHPHTVYISKRGFICNMILMKLMVS